MTEQQALAYQVTHLHLVLVEASKSFEIRTQIMLVLMAIYR